MSEATTYGSSFSRATKVNVDSPNFPNTNLLFLSGTASIDNKGKVVGINDLETQIKRMHHNIGGLLLNSNMRPEDIVHAATYVKDGFLDEAKKIILSDPNNQDYGLWYNANICRDQWLLEKDGLYINSQDKGNITLCKFIDAYYQYHKMVMVGKPAPQTSIKLKIDDLNFLFIYDCAYTDGLNTEVDSNIFQEKIMRSYIRVTDTLKKERGVWTDVVNTRLNISVFLDHPPNIQTNQNYYDLFNGVRTKEFHKNGINLVESLPYFPCPASTGVGIINSDKSLLFSMSTLAIFKDK
tara:strand:+ start:4679 stop:5563 length:885 start_codon:yes stop_codon:yes gene_type:complete